MDEATDLVPDLFGTPERLVTPLQLSAAMAVDLFNDGLLIGAALTATAGLGLLLALSQVAANVPGGLAANAALTNYRASGRIRAVAVGSSTLAAFVGAALGYLALRDAPEVYTLLVLSVTSGLLATVVIEEIIPQAQQGRDARLATVFLVGGFSLFTLLAGTSTSRRCPGAPGLPSPL